MSSDVFSRLGVDQAKLSSARKKTRFFVNCRHLVLLKTGDVRQCNKEVS
jgi:hypothetical protein